MKATRRQLPLFKARVRRGQRALDKPPGPPACKRPVRAFVHYQSMGGELCAFEVQASAQWIDRARYAAAPHLPNVVAHFVALTVDPRARLVVLPSQVAAGEAVEKLAA